MEVNYKLVLSYDGKNYHGWAIQKNNITIQGVIEETLSTIFNEKIKVNASGRTDAHVHAYNQVINFKSKKDIENVKLLRSLNEMLPNDIIIKDVEHVNKNFHARFSAKLKEYIYKICTDKFKIHENDYVLLYDKPISISKLKKVAKLFVGKHNFLSFSVSDIKDTVREIKKINIVQKKEYIFISVIGDGFLRNMVRMLVGAMLDFNEGKKSLEDIKKLLSNPKKGSSITKVRASGLYLNYVKYE